MGVKRLLRDLSWRAHGHGIANPALPGRVESIVFICLGNICRSPFAEHVARMRIERTGAAIRCLSAGIRPSQAASSPPDARHAARAHGVSLDAHLPLPLTSELVDGADLLVVMELAQVRMVRSMFPDKAAAVVLLSLHDPEAAGAYERCNIEDPFGQPAARYTYCYRRVARAVDGLLDALGVQP